MKKLCLFLWCLISLQTAFANDNDTNKSDSDKVNSVGTKRYQRIEGSEQSPNFPGSLRFGFGISFLRGAPQDMEIGLWKSRSLDIYYIADFPLGNSRFTFNPGIGIGIERFGFNGQITLGETTEGTVIVPFTDFEAKRSLLNANYLDIPLELKYHFGADRNRGLNLAIGGRIGYLIDSKTKVNYELNGNDVKLKSKEDFNLNRLRYGVTARIGLGRFNLFYYQALSPLFKSNLGPSEGDINHFKVGLSFAAF